MITAITITAIAPSLTTAYGKNGLPSFFSCEYSRRYASFWAWFMRAAPGVTPSMSASRQPGLVELVVVVVRESALSHGGAEMPSFVTR